VLVAVTTLSFDISVLELYLPLTLGAKVVIASRDEAVDGHSLQELLEEHHANVMQATPVTWRLLLEAGWSGGAAFKALVGGEALPKDLAEQLIENEVQLWNMYGPTETTVWSTCARITDTAEGITIGTPIDNTTVYILDEHRNLCPVGVPGELYIGGDGVTLGYWKRLELTDDRYLDDPFSTDPGALMYGTGDKARWRNDGTLEHLGRLDNQVKVRGFRIELGDIETNILHHAAIQEAVVVAREAAPGDQRLIAYFVAGNSPDGIVDQLREQLFAALPEYMVPAHFVALDKLPRTDNGKLNRKALPEFDFSQTGQYSIIELPRSRTEETLTGIWTEVLGLEQVGTQQNFFELGGYSLLAMQIGSRVRQAFSIDMPMREFLSSPTILDQATHVDEILAASLQQATLDEAALWASSARPLGLTGDREEIVL
jgi:acyl-coenzyme A synthetase/AMP-(fatty) acid ligase/acyl carrier protein